ncbi:MAG: DUF2304 domain-containing protein [Candidatus Jacksonbacteria bacterium]|nr:DUF2304 domain-containing protein [Candidatus Jacksonbacteria bacterium]
MNLIQVILLIIIAFIILKTFQKYYRRMITAREFFLWTIFWGCAGLLVVFPNATQRVANFVGIGRGVDLVIYLALLMLFSALFYLLVKVETIERAITKIVREMAEKNE